MTHLAKIRQGDIQGSKKKRASGRLRLIVAYSTVLALCLTLLVGIKTVVLEANEDHAGNAHINLATGSTNGIQPDDRQGINVTPVRVSSLSRAAQLAECQLRMHLSDEGHKHIPPGSAPPNYRTNPPTSGKHVEAPFQQADGAYREMPEEIAFVHSLEHGRLEIQYSLRLFEEQQLELIGLYETIHGGTLLFPNDRMPYEVAATTWRHLLGCRKYRGAATLDAIRAFGRATWGRYGGQPVGALQTAAPTPYEPTDSN